MSAGLSGTSSNAIMVPIYDKIPLSHLLEAAVQKLYHELYTMADVYVSYSWLSSFLHKSIFYLVYTVNQI